MTSLPACVMNELDHQNCVFVSTDIEPEQEAMYIALTFRESYHMSMLECGHIPTRNA